MAAEELIVFTRFPEVGRVKTRLIGALGPQGACDLHRRLTEQAVGEARRWGAKAGVPPRVCFDGGDAQRMRAWLGDGIALRAQGEGDLGARMDRAFEDAFRGGARTAVIMGTDCPELTAPVLGRAFAQLERADLVLGPARDGGYYLIGLTGRVPELFAGLPWGTERVRARTLEIADRLGLSTRQLEELADVDRPADLERLRLP